MRRSRSKITCPFCKERFWSLERFYAHMENCEERKKWENEKPCWETDLQGKGDKKNEKKNNGFFTKDKMALVFFRRRMYCLLEKNRGT